MAETLAKMVVGTRMRSGGEGGGEGEGGGDGSGEGGGEGGGGEGRGGKGGGDGGVAAPGVVVRRKSGLSHRPQ